MMRASEKITLAAMPGSPLFRHLGGEQLSSMLDIHSAQRRHAKDTQLIRPRDPAAPLLTIVSGWAFRYSLLSNGKRQILSVSLPGDTIGLDTLLSGAPVYPVQSATAVVFCSVNHADAMRLFRETEWFRRHALDALARDRAEAEAALTRIGQCSAEERVAAVLLKLYKDLSSRGLAANNVFTLELTQQQLADWVGLTVVHLNRVLGRLRARHLIDINRGQLTINDMGEMECLALWPRRPEPLPTGFEAFSRIGGPIGF